MKVYKIQITDKDGYSGKIQVKCKNKTEALKEARLYIKQWQLAPARIDYCQTVTV